MIHVVCEAISARLIVTTYWGSLCSRFVAACCICACVLMLYGLVGKQECGVWALQSLSTAMQLYCWLFVFECHYWLSHISDSTLTAPSWFLSDFKDHRQRIPKNCYKTIFGKISTEDIFFPTYTHYK